MHVDAEKQEKEEDDNGETTCAIRTY